MQDYSLRPEKDYTAKAGRTEVNLALHTRGYSLLRVVSNEDNAYKVRWSIITPNGTIHPQFLNVRMDCTVEIDGKRYVGETPGGMFEAVVMDKLGGRGINQALHVLNVAHRNGPEELRLGLERSIAEVKKLLE